MKESKYSGLLKYTLCLADNNLILGQRLGEWCGHGPVLEQDIAMTNIALDLIGQARMYFQYAAEIEGQGKTEDDLAFLRDNRHYFNIQLVEQANGDWGKTLMRQFLFDSFHYYFLDELKKSEDERLAAIAEKSIKEATYHIKFSSEWCIRLGDGTDESHQRMQNALDDLWMYKEEPVIPTDLDERMKKEGIAPDLGKIKEARDQKIHSVLDEAGLKPPENTYMQRGGKEGLHTEYLGHILSDMQFMQKSYPGQEW